MASCIYWNFMVKVCLNRSKKIIEIIADMHTCSPESKSWNTSSINSFCIVHPLPHCTTLTLPLDCYFEILQPLFVSLYHSLSASLWLQRGWWPSRWWWPSLCCYSWWGQSSGCWCSWGCVRGWPTSWRSSPSLLWSSWEVRINSILNIIF